MVLSVNKPTSPAGITLEAWTEGFMVGSLTMMVFLTLANMKKGVLLHKLILIELSSAMLHGTFIFFEPPVYSWYLSTTALLLNASYSLHNVVAWIKNKPFLPRWGSIFYISTVVLAQVYWILEIAANFFYFSGQSRVYLQKRPLEFIFRDPWWVFTVCSLLYMVKSRYEFGYIELVRVSPTFVILFGTMLASLVFTFVDILAVTYVVNGLGLPNGINPFWKLAFVSKCFTDTIILDDFKTVLDRLKQRKLQLIGDLHNRNSRRHSNNVSNYAEMHENEEEQKYDLDISNPLDFARPDAGQPSRRVQTAEDATLERVDVEVALCEIVSTS